MSSETRRLLGWIMAGGGFIALLLGLCLGGLAIALQMMEPSNATGFVVVFGLCPLPLIVLGAAFLFVGLAVVYFARHQG